jgi:predicted nucleic acid-binding protein
VVRHLADLLEADMVAVPVAVRLEVLAGAPKAAVAPLALRFRGTSSLIPERDTWRTVEDWVETSVAAGQRFGILDLLIAAIAHAHRAPLWSLDADFGRMARLGFVQLYAAP